MPFRNETFDAAFCCYLLELLSGDDIARTLAEFHRVLRPGCRLTLVLIGQNTAIFNSVYKVQPARPAFWGRQVERRVPNSSSPRSFACSRSLRPADLLSVSRAGRAKMIPSTMVCPT